ncbi:aldo/keto reductase [Streptomyces sp. NBC_01320]|uniref:aldo/keto reductase n=1 Tax=Streptomyces sp. NBC_01320 TaxID=2903824 RepID=UPI002E129A30|nr:aldo/keto reductase [Streptomyces sp. NBC_01320]
MPVPLRTPVSDALAARRPLGRTGQNVCPVALGTMQFGWTASDVDAMRILDAYMAAGGNLLDTANMYGGDQSVESFEVNKAHVGVSEDILGRWLASRGCRDDVVVTTKVRARMWDGPDGEGLNRAHIMKAVEASLRRLRTDHIDVLYAHWPDPAAQAEEWLTAFADLVGAGKVAAVGTSNFCGFAGYGDLLSPLLELADRAGLPRIQVEQPRYNLMNRHEYEETLQRITLREDLGIVTYSSLAGGFLSGAVDPGKPPTGARARHLSQYCTPEGSALLARLRQIAAAHHVPVASVSLAWTLAQPGVTAALIGASTVDDVAQASFAPAVRLTDEESAALSALSWRASPPEFVDW